GLGLGRVLHRDPFWNGNAVLGEQCLRLVLVEIHSEIVSVECARGAVFSLKPRGLAKRLGVRPDDRMTAFDAQYRVNRRRLARSNGGYDAVRPKTAHSIPIARCEHVTRGRGRFTTKTDRSKRGSRCA